MKCKERVKQFDAVQWKGNNVEEIMIFFGSYQWYFVDENKKTIIIHPIPSEVGITEPLNVPVDSYVVHKTLHIYEVETEESFNEKYSIVKGTK